MAPISCWRPWWRSRSQGERLVQSGMASSSRENASGLMPAATPSCEAGLFAGNVRNRSGTIRLIEGAAFRLAGNVFDGAVKSRWLSDRRMSSMTESCTNICQFGGPLPFPALSSFGLSRVPSQSMEEVKAMHRNLLNRDMRDINLPWNRRDMSEIKKLVADLRSLLPSLLIPVSHSHPFKINLTQWI